MKTQTICANVSKRLLTKANRLFTGSLQGRIIELLQNARRAGAGFVGIDYRDGNVSVADDGRGIDDFAKLLDLGASGWDEATEVSEDPAGVGIFCLAPRKVCIRSRGKKVIIEGNGWTGSPVTMEADDGPLDRGTVLEFADEAWTHATVDSNAVFCGMDVFAEGTACPRERFVSDAAVAYPDLGCRIEVRERAGLTPWHHNVKRDRSTYANVLVNFHGQVVVFDYHPVSEHDLYYLVDLTGGPTDIRLMLPARTCLVENDALAALKEALEYAAFRYLERRGHHTLPYKEYARARDLGIALPEAAPTFSVGLLHNDMSPEPVAVEMPKDFPLSRCYQHNPDRLDANEFDESNIHLLAALGTFEQPFVPVGIGKSFDGYSWAKLPTIDNVEVQVGKSIYKDWLWSGELNCVDGIRITARTSDGKEFTSPVCMAIRPEPDDERQRFSEGCVLVTPEAQNRLMSDQLWYHLGGWSEDGDTYDTQLSSFEQDLDRFWANVIGPEEYLRRSIVRALDDLREKWRAVTITSDGTVIITRKNGRKQTLAPNSSATPPQGAR